MLRQRPKRSLFGPYLLGSVEPALSIFSNYTGSCELPRLRWLALTVLILGGILALYPAMAETVVPSDRHAVQLSYAPVVGKVAPAVVNIYTRRRVSTSRKSLFNDPFFQRFLEGIPFGVPRERIESSLGSGVIIGPEGLIVTNQHVIAGSDEIIVVLSDRREFEAKIVGSDDKIDLAVLLINPDGEPLPFLGFGDSDGLEVGDIVLAIGNPFGVGQTVTSGIVSALGRSALGLSDWRSFIQTDAAINPGNSGGALVNLSSELIGVNTAIFSQSGGSIGIGFAIPANLVRVIVDSLVAGGKAVRPWSGILAQSVDYEIGRALGLPSPRGVIIKEIHSLSPAWEAGLRIGDVILSIDGHDIDSPQGLRYRTVTSPLGVKIPIVLFRDGKSADTKMQVVMPPEDPLRDIRVLDGPNPLSGATVGNLSPGFSQELGLEWMRTGVVVLQVESGYAARLGLRAGDIVLEIAGEKISSTEQLLGVLGQEAVEWEITIDRGGKLMSVMVRL